MNEKKKTYFVQIWKWQSTQSTANQTIKTDADIKIFFFCWINIKIFKSGHTRKKKKVGHRNCCVGPQIEPWLSPQSLCCPRVWQLSPTQSYMIHIPKILARPRLFKVKPHYFPLLNLSYWICCCHFNLNLMWLLNSSWFI